MKIGLREINNSNPPYIIAEISANHGGSLSKAKQLIVAAKRAGADAVKTQAYEAGTITLDVNKADFIIQGGLWQGRTLYELYSKACTPFRWHPELYKLANNIGITIFSSVFDYASIDMLESLGCPAYKIASMEIVDTPLIRRAASTGNPLIISTGMASMEEVNEADDAAGTNALALLHCTSEYPATADRASLLSMLDLKASFPHREIGLSDHTMGNLVPIAATALGATIIEKHLKLNDEDQTEDTLFSLSESEFKWMADDVRTTYRALSIQETEPGDNSSRQFRRSLYAVADIEEGGTFTEQNVRSIRPGYGMHPKKLPTLLGKKARQRYRLGDRIN